MDALGVWLLSDPLDRQKLALLVFCMVEVQVLVARLAWRMRSAGVGRERLIAVRDSWLGRGAAQVLRLFYHVGVPLLVLWRGALYPDIYRAMGIATTYTGRWYLGSLLLGGGEPGWALYVGVGVAIGSVTLGLLLAVWAWYARMVLEPFGPREGAILHAVPFWVALREALYLQLLWALYRGVANLLTDDRLWAAFISLALISLPWILDPRRRRDLLGARGYLVVQAWLFALATAFLSITIQALWFLVAMHTLWIWFSGQALAHFSGATAYRSASPPRWF
jgi:hypothetical protein